MLQWGCQNRPSARQSALERRLTRVLPYGTIHPSGRRTGERLASRGESLGAPPHRLGVTINEPPPWGDQDSPLVTPNRT